MNENEKNYVTLVKDRGSYSLVYGNDPFTEGDVTCVLRVNNDTMEFIKTEDIDKLLVWIKDKMGHYIPDIDRY